MGKGIPMPSLMAIISGNADPLRRELQAVQRMAAQTGVNIRQGLEGGGGAHGGRAGVLRETLVLMREISRGNWTRVPGSITILADRMGLLKLVTGQTATTARALSDAWEQQAQRAGIAAIAATRKAAASQAALYAEGGETEANLAAAVADEEKAAASIANARATQEKAIASAEAATAAEAEGAATKASIGVMGVLGAAVVGVAAGFYLYSKRVKELTDDLAGLPIADFELTYIPKYLQAANQAVELQKEINSEIQKTIDLYNSAAEAAGRVAKATQEHFDHERKMNNLKEQTELLGAKTPEERAAIRKKYSDMELDRQARENNENLANLYQEQFGLQVGGKNKQDAANSIHVSSKKADEENLKRKKQESDAAQKYLDDLEKSKNNPSLKELLMANLKAEFGFETPSQKAAVEKAAEERRQEALNRIQAYKDAVDETTANDEKRKNKDALGKSAASDLAKAAGLTAQINDLKSSQDKSLANKREEAEAELALEAARDRQKTSATGAAHLDLTDNQRIGARIGLPGLQNVENINRQMLTELRKLNSHHGGTGHTSSHAFGGTHF